jgi:hypothetical protein
MGYRCLWPAYVNTAAAHNSSAVSLFLPQAAAEMGALACCRPNRVPCSEQSLLLSLHFSMSLPTPVDIRPKMMAILGRMPSQDDSNDRIALLQGTLDLLPFKTLRRWN